MHIEVISNKVQGLLDEHRLGCFLWGLKEEIQLRIWMLNP
jgi:hypothetical protein